MIEELLPPPVVAVEAFGDIHGAELFPEERAVIARAGESRRKEFMTVRACARMALARLGKPAAPVLRGPRGAPQWPAGVVGSITHCAGYRGVAVASTDHIVSLGIDAEPNEPLPDPSMLGFIARDEERARIADLASGMSGVCWDRLLFSAKESVYKAWFPLTLRWLDFESADVVMDGLGGTFTARLLVPGPVVGGSPLTQMRGRWLAAHGLLVTVVLVLA